MVANIHCVVSPITINLVELKCRAGTRGCMSCKIEIVEKVNTALRLLRERRIYVDRNRIVEVLA